MKENAIKEIRERAGLSQRGLAEKYGIPTRTIEDWETDRRTPPAYVVNLLARAVEDEKISTTAWLFGKYRKADGHGSHKLYNTKDEAVHAAQEEWAALPYEEKKTYTQDPEAIFEVEEVPVCWSDVSRKYEPVECLGMMDLQRVWSAL